MKIAIIGQQDFGKAVLDAFLARGDEVAGVFCVQTLSLDVHELFIAVLFHSDLSVGYAGCFF